MTAHQSEEIGQGCHYCGTTSDTPLITCDPRRQFGAPCIAGTRIPADGIAEMVWAGDSVDSLVDAYEVDRDAVLWCCAWWVLNGYLRPRRGERRVRWHLWAEHARRVLGGWEPGPLCDPDDHKEPR